MPALKAVRELDVESMLQSLVIGIFSLLGMAVTVRLNQVKPMMSGWAGRDVNMDLIQAGLFPPFSVTPTSVMKMGLSAAARSAVRLGPKVLVKEATAPGTARR